jgi:hypothetical protein
MLESVEAVESRYGSALQAVEWLFTILFTVAIVTMTTVGDATSRLEPR